MELNVAMVCKQLPTAVIVGSAVLLAGCSALTGLDEIQEQECAPTCSADAAQTFEASAGNDTSAADSTPAPDSTGGDASIGSDASEASTEQDASIDTSNTQDTSPPVDTGSSADVVVDSPGVDAKDTGAGIDAPNETSTPDAGCGATNTVSNCGACGHACAGTSSSTSSASCSGTTCTYMCASGHLDCNASVPYDPDGCECNVTNTTTSAACCGTTCPTQHTDGVTESGYPTTVNFYDCNPVATYNQTTAQEACLNFTGGNASECAVASCINTDDTICAQTSTSCPCWTFSGTYAGSVAVGIGSSANQCWCAGPPASNITTTTWQ